MLPVVAEQQSPPKPETALEKFAAVLEQRIDAINRANIALSAMVGRAFGESSSEGTGNKGPTPAGHVGIISNHLDVMNELLQSIHGHIDRLLQLL